jgi:hypothetical protein
MPIELIYSHTIVAYFVTFTGKDLSLWALKNEAMNVYFLENKKINK